MKKENKNLKTLTDFIEYCTQHPEERFWQALRNWARVDTITVNKTAALLGEDKRTWESDTFYWE
jgi:hypothetical protein